MASSSTTPRPSIDSYFPIQSPFTQTPQDATNNKWPNGRRGSTASSNMSLAPVPETRMSRDLSKNAIANLLENPRSKAILPKPTTRDIPPVTLTNIDKVNANEFDNYLSISKEYARFVRAKERELSESARVNSPTAGTPIASSGDASQFRRGSITTLDESRRPSTAWSEASALSPSRPTFDTGSRRSSARRYSLARTPLSTVPRVYFEDNFHLENPRTFDVVSERSHVISTPLPEETEDGEAPILDGRKALATNAILQEKLSWYMDTVEVHLIKEISSASTGFFAALGSLRDLHAEAEASVQKIQALRTELAKLNQDQAVAGLDIVRMRKRRANIEKLVNTVDQVALVIDMTGQIETDLEQNELSGAITKIEENEALMMGRGTWAEKQPLVDLQNFRALDAIRLDMTSLRKKIGKAYENQFVDTLLKDLRDHAASATSSDTLYRFYHNHMRQQSQLSRTKPPPSPRPTSQAYAQLPQSLQPLLLSHLEGLRRTQSVESAVQAYRDAVVKETKSIIRRNMPSDDDAVSTFSGRSSAPGPGRTTAEKSSSLARTLRALGPQDAEDMLISIYTNISEVLRRLGAQQKLLLDVTSGMNSVLTPRMESPTLLSPQTPKSFADTFNAFYSMDISELISSSVETAQTQVVKVLKVRSEQNSRLSLGEFLRFFMLNKLFSTEYEALSGKVSSALQAVVGNQLKEFIQDFHNKNIKDLASVIEVDKWEAKDFDDLEKARLDRILEAATQDADSWLQWARVYEPPPLPPQKVVPQDGEVQSTTGPKVRTAMIDNQRFVLPESGIAVLRNLESYESIIAMIPSSTADISTNVLEFLKLFNSRVCQVILGAGATKSAGLKHITTKHLALASQALSIVIAVIPYVRECVRRHMGPAASGGTLIPEFDKLKRNYQEHQAEIHSKLISIMSDRLMAHVRIIRQNIQWDEAPPNDKPNPYMETLVKETTTLHKVLSKHLPEAVLMSIMQPVFAVYKKRLVEAYEATSIKTENGKQRLIRDAQYFYDRMAKLDGSEGVGDEILATAKAKAVGSSSTSTATTSTTTTTGTNTTKINGSLVNGNNNFASDSNQSVNTVGTATPGATPLATTPSATTPAQSDAVVNGGGLDTKDSARNEVDKDVVVETTSEPVKVKTMAEEMSV